MYSDFKGKAIGESTESRLLLHCCVVRSFVEWWKERDVLPGRLIQVTTPRLGSSEEFA